MAVELVLELALQRGSLSHLLQWIELALNVASLQSSICISTSSLTHALEVVNGSSTSGSSSASTILKLRTEEQILLYQAALLLMQEVNTLNLTECV